MPAAKHDVRDQSPPRHPPLNIEYRHNFPLDPTEVARVFDAAGIKRRADGVLVGVCRALTDYSYCCYLSDLAVDRAHQGHGIGKELIRRVQVAIGDEVSLILLAAPGAMSYYPSVGFAKVENGFIIRRAR